MALEKSIELSSGIIATYWKIIGVDINFNYSNNVNRAQVIIAGYATETTRQNGKSEIVTRLIDIAGADFNNVFASFSSDPRSNIYIYLKSAPDGELFGSTDI